MEDTQVLACEKLRDEAGSFRERARKRAKRFHGCVSAAPRHARHGREGARETETQRESARVSARARAARASVASRRPERARCAQFHTSATVARVGSRDLRVRGALAPAERERARIWRAAGDGGTPTAAPEARERRLRMQRGAGAPTRARARSRRGAS